MFKQLMEDIKTHNQEKHRLFSGRSFFFFKNDDNNNNNNKATKNPQIIVVKEIKEQRQRP